MKIAKLIIEGYIGELDSSSAFAGEKNFSLNNLKTFLNNLSSDVTDIHYKVNSGGGSVHEGWDIHNALKDSGKTLTSIGEGIVGSIATVLYMAAPLSNRKLIKGTKFFVHNPYWLPEESEPMRANEILALGKDLKFEQDRLLSFYANESNASSLELAPFLDKETDLTAENAVKMGFASEVIDEHEEIEYRNYKLVAMIDIKDKSNKNKTNMEQTILDKATKLFKNMARIAKGKFFDMDITATDKEGNSVNLFIESETEDLVDKAAFIVDAEGNQSPAPDGDYVDGDGRTIAVLGGKVAEVANKAEEATEPMDALKAELAAKTAELDALKAEKSTMEANLLAKETENEAIKANVTTLETEFKALKEVIIGNGADFDLGTQSFKARKVENDSPNNAFLNELAKKFKK